MVNALKYELRFDVAQHHIRVIDKANTQRGNLECSIRDKTFQNVV
ncbi:hypothetical protein LX92_02450 [Maribacter polysiphoniae]|uniref:Uncharacterized protein n=1 Tax=Maribacter polysiphoniae TaxID=429344 RepID=A0A316DYD3_9FLAO|nr:hypothetical protein LX92_02450 [Maribacter polysiphoniae]